MYLPHLATVGATQGGDLPAFGHLTGHLEAIMYPHENQGMMGLAGKIQDLFHKVFKEWVWKWLQKGLLFKFEQLP